MRKTTIQNCSAALRCKQRWSDLSPVPGSSTERFCRQCQHQVFFCRTDEELAGNVRLGRCVAFEISKRGPKRQIEHWVGGLRDLYDTGSTPKKGK